MKRHVSSGYEIFARCYVLRTLYDIVGAFVIATYVTYMIDTDGARLVPAPALQYLESQKL